MTTVPSTITVQIAGETRTYALVEEQAPATPTAISETASKVPSFRPRKRTTERVDALYEGMFANFPGFGHSIQVTNHSRNGYDYDQVQFEAAASHSLRNLGELLRYRLKRDHFDGSFSVKPSKSGQTVSLYVRIYRGV